VNLAVRVFNDFITQALMELGSKHNSLHWHETIICIKIISTWWKVVETTNLTKGWNKKKLNQQPLTKRVTEPKRFLHFF